MASKKFKLLLAIVLLLSTGAIAQVSGTSSVFDSAVIPSKRMPQQNEFWNNQYNFPAKPRDMWEVGVSLGVFTISGDVPVQTFTFPNFAVHVRKSFGYLFSLRLQYLNAVGKGMQYLVSNNFAKNPAWAKYNAPVRSFAGPLVGSVPARGTNFDPVYYNYKTKVQDLSLQGIFTFNNIRFHKNKTGIVIYGGAGIGATIYKSMVNALDANGNPYIAQFRAVQAQYGNGTVKQRKEIRSALKAAMDNTYETPAEGQGTRRPILGNQTLKPSGTVLGGIAYRLSKRINLALEDRWTFVKDDLLDGQRWQEHAMGDAVLTRDFDSYNYVSLGLNANLGAKSTEPLYWLNPLDYAYNELKNQRTRKINPDCPDADGDGVCDHLDREPNTPANCPVDTHGVTKDTDGDGVPDCKDKQLITPTECQPVDADGVGKCPVKCCDNPQAAATTKCSCDYPSLSFKGNGAGLSGDNKAMLASVASKMKAGGSDCKINITGYPEASKAAQASCQSRLKAIVAYLTEKEGISADRISFDCVPEGGDKNTVDIKCNN